MLQTRIGLVDEKIYFNIEAIRKLDPLHADDKLDKLPDMNKSCDIAALVNILQYLTKKNAETEIEFPEAGLAAMRDIGIVLGSLKRHGVEPVSAVPDVEQQLLNLGYATGMIPRDTVHHYTTWNPVGIRRRMYTRDEQEGWLQDAVALVFPNLSASLEISETLSEMDARDVRFAPTVNMLCHASKVMVEAIESVTAKVSPIFFAQILRPYFEEITVAGKTYLGPAAAQSPLWLIDLCVWASDRNQPDYQSFLSESIEYSLPPWRKFYLRHTLKRSIVSRISDDIKTIKNQPMEALIRSAMSLTELLTTLRQFRSRHIGMAHRAYSEEVRLYDHGSGGAPVALLKQILDLTRENEKLMRVASDFSRHRDNQIKTEAKSLISSL